MKELIDYINELGFTKSYHVSEIVHTITDKIFITIELNTNVFIVDYRYNDYKDAYTHISNIDELNKIYEEKTGDKLTYRLRKAKLKTILNDNR